MADKLPCPECGGVGGDHDRLCWTGDIARGEKGSVDQAARYNPVKNA